MTNGHKRESWYFFDKDGEELEGEEHYRMRRGKRVHIPAEWAGKVAHPQSIRKRYSKMPPKQRDGECRSWHRSDKSLDIIKHKRGDYLDE